MLTQEQREQFVRKGYVLEGPETWQDMISECRDFREITGEAGDFFLLHPYLLHAVSQNRLRRPRAICNILHAD